MVWELIAFNTDCRYRQDVRYREYTASGRKAEAFDKIPRIQFTDSGHGIEFSASEHKGARKPLVSTLREYVQKHLRPEKESKPFHVHIYKVVGKIEMDVTAENCTEAKAKALEIVKNFGENHVWPSSDCAFIAMDVK